MVIQGMNPLLKDWIQVISWGVAIVGGLIAAFAAIYQLRESTKQRKSELRWKQANLGRELLDSVFEEAYDTLLMLDYSKEGRVFDNIPGGNKEVRETDILNALDVENTEPKSIYIRERLERLFFNLERFEYLIENNLLTFDDVSCPTEYYVSLMANHKNNILNYLKAVKYKRAITFLNRFSVWGEA